MLSLAAERIMGSGVGTSFIARGACINMQVFKGGIRQHGHVLIVHSCSFCLCNWFMYVNVTFSSEIPPKQHGCGGSCCRHWQPLAPITTLKSAPQTVATTTTLQKETGSGTFLYKALTLASMLVSSVPLLV